MKRSMCFKVPWTTARGVGAIGSGQGRRQVGAGQGRSQGARSGRGPFPAHRGVRVRGQGRGGGEGGGGGSSSSPHLGIPPALLFKQASKGVPKKKERE